MELFLHLMSWDGQIFAHLPRRSHTTEPFSLSNPVERMPRPSHSASQKSFHHLHLDDLGHPPRAKMQHYLLPPSLEFLHTLAKACRVLLHLWGNHLPKLIQGEHTISGNLQISPHSQKPCLRVQTPERTSGVTDHPSPTVPLLYL